MPRSSSGADRPDPADPPGDGPARDDGERGLAPGGEDRLHPRVRMALATWPQIDPAVEAIVNQIGDALMHRYILPLEIVGLLLTAALIGAVIIAIDPKDREEPE